MLVSLVLESQLAKVTDNVLHLGVVHAAVLATKIGETGNHVQQVVGDGNDNHDTNGVHPDNDQSDGVSVAVGGLLVRRHWAWERALVDVRVEPSESAEESCQNIDTKDGADELPRWESLSTTGDEDEPVLSEGNLEEENLLKVTVVGDDTSVWHVHGTTGDPGGNSKFDSENNGDDPDLGELPFDRALLRVGVVVSDGDSGQIGEESDENDELGSDDLANDDDGSDQVDLQMKTESDTVLDVRLHTLENLAGSLDGEDNG